MKVKVFALKKIKTCLGATRALIRPCRLWVVPTEFLLLREEENKDNFWVQSYKIIKSYSLFNFNNLT